MNDGNKKLDSLHNIPGPEAITNQILKRDFPHGGKLTFEYKTSDGNIHKDSFEICSRTEANLKGGPPLKKTHFDGSIEYFDISSFSSAEETGFKVGGTSRLPIPFGHLMLSNEPLYEITSMETSEKTPSKESFVSEMLAYNTRFPVTEQEPIVVATNKLLVVVNKIGDDDRCKVQQYRLQDEDGTKSYQATQEGTVKLEKLFVETEYEIKTKAVLESDGTPIWGTDEGNERPEILDHLKLLQVENAFKEFRKSVGNIQNYDLNSLPSHLKILFNNISNILFSEDSSEPFDQMFFSNIVHDALSNTNFDSIMESNKGFQATFYDKFNEFMKENTPEIDKGTGVIRSFISKLLKKNPK